MSLIRSLLLASSWLPYKRFLHDTRHPRRAQARLWRETWAELREAPFWRAMLGDGDLPREPPALAELPLTRYGDYRDALARSFDTGVSELSGQPVIFWAESGGTTGAPKIFPITARYKRQFQATTPPLLHALARRYGGLLRRPVLYFAEAMPRRRSPSGVDVGFISAYNYRNIPGFLQRHYAFPLEVLEDAETFLRWGPLYAAATDLSAMIAITPASVVQLAERLRAQAASYWPYLAGERQPPAPLPPLRVSRARLERVRRALGKDPFCFAELWPSLQFVGCWKAATCGLELPALARYLRGRVPVVDVTYSATEGWINVPLPELELGGPVHPGAIVLEFLPAGAEAKADALLPLWALEPGEDYEVFITSTMGLIRYRLLDVVRCSGRFNATPVVAFSHKATAEISLGLTRVSEAQLVQAMERAQLEPAGRWFFGPRRRGGGLALYCESDAAELGPALERADRELQRLNKYYRMDIEQGLLRPLGIVALSADHAAWRGVAHHAQQKPQILRQEPPPR